jgi:hypothetical protein
MKRALLAIVGLCLATVAFAQSAPLILRQGRVAQPASTDTLLLTPSYPGLNTTRKGTSVNIGGCLSTDYLSGASSQATTSALVGCVVQPSGSYSGTATWPDAALAGYIVTTNPNNTTAVGVYGTAGTTASGAGLYGGNFTTVNCRLWAVSCTPGGGFDFAAMYGLEIDVNSYSKAGAVAPTGAVKGVISHLNGDVTPATSSQAFDIQASGGAQWGSGYTSEAAATTVGMQLNSVSASNASGASQSIQLVARGASGTPAIATIQALATTGAVSVSTPVVLPSYTVAGLPTCNSALKGGMAAVTDATAPTYNAALTGGGAVVIPVFCDGSAWKSH